MDGTQNMTPQQRWAIKRKSSGKCSRCSKRKLGRYKWYCDYCQAKVTLYMKRYRAAQKAANLAKQKALERP